MQHPPRPAGRRKIHPPAARPPELTLLVVLGDLRLVLIHLLVVQVRRPHREPILPLVAL